MGSVVVLDDYQHAAQRSGPWERLPPGQKVEFESAHFSEEGELLSRLRGAEIVVAMRERTAFSRQILSQLPALKLIVTTGMANVAIDMTSAQKLGITVAGTGHLASAPPEMAWAMILSLARHVTEEDGNIRRGIWQSTVGADLAGSTLGIVGLGRYGTQVARIGLAFGMRVLAWSENLDADVARSQNVEPVSKRVLFESSDFVTLHLRLSDRTRGVVGAAELQAMKGSAYLINTARAELVQREPLLAALNHLRIAGAGIDVFEKEPLSPNDELLNAPNTLLTPHIGYVTERGYAQYFREVVEDICGFLAGEPVRVLNG